MQFSLFCLYCYYFQIQPIFCCRKPFGQWDFSLSVPNILLALRLYESINMILGIITLWFSQHLHGLFNTNIEIEFKGNFA